MVNKINYWISMWEKRCYKKGIPDEVPLEIFDKVPSYKRIAIAILKNDHSLKTLGFTPKESKWYGIYKRKELIELGKIKQTNQLNLF